MNILIIAAIKEEVNALLSKLELKQVDSDGKPVYQGAKGDAQITLLISGMGPEHAVNTLKQYLAEHPDVDIIINPGFAGGLDPKRDTGDLLHPLCVKSETGDIELAELSSLPESVDRTAVLYTAAELIDSTKGKASLYQSTSCAAVDMETYALAECAKSFDKQLISLRAISDPATMALPKEAATWVKEDGSPDMAKAMSFVASRPMMMPKLMKLNSHAKAARQALADALTEALANAIDGK